MKLIGNISAGLGANQSVHLNFSKDVLLDTVRQAIDKDFDESTGAITNLSCRDVIHLAEEISKTIATGSEEKKRSILERFLNRHEMSDADIDLLAKVLLVSHSYLERSPHRAFSRHFREDGN